MFRDELFIGCSFWLSAVTAATFSLLPRVAIREGSFLTSFHG